MRMLYFPFWRTTCRDMVACVCLSISLCVYISACVYLPSVVVVMRTHLSVERKKFLMKMIKTFKGAHPQSPKKKTRKTKNTRKTKKKIRWIISNVDLTSHTWRNFCCLCRCVVDHFFVVYLFSTHGFFLWVSYSVGVHWLSTVSFFCTVCVSTEEKRPRTVHSLPAFFTHWRQFFGFGWRLQRGGL